MDWTDADREQLKEHWLAGKSADKVAQIMGRGITRSAVLGQVHRLKLPSHGKNNKPIRTKPVKAEPVSVAEGSPVKAVAAPKAKNGVRLKDPKVAAIVHRTERAQAVAANVERIKTQMSSADIWQPLPGSSPVRLEDHREHQCRWPLGDIKDGTFQFCGEPRYQLNVDPRTQKPILHIYCGVHLLRHHGRTEQ